MMVVIGTAVKSDLELPPQHNIFSQQFESVPGSQPSKFAVITR